MTEFDPWAVTTGLSDTITGTITDAYFSFDNSYDNGNTCVLRLTVADPNLGEQSILYPCRDFEPYDNGNKVRHTSGQPKNYNASSGMGVLIKSAIDAGLRDTLTAKGDPFTADIWKGLDVTFREKQFSYTDRKTKEERTYSRMLIDTVNTDTAPTTPSAPSVAADPLDGLDPALRGTLRAIAASCADADEFIEKAFTDTSITIPADIETLIVNPEFFAALNAS
jgi:hypothetical protein